MSKAPRQFATQLRYAIQRAKTVEGKGIGIIQDELGYAIGRQGRTAIESYLKEHIQHVGRTFTLSFDRLQPDEPRDLLARRLLVHMAHFAPGEPV